MVAGGLSQLLSEHFYIASTGRQRFGDAASHSLEVGIQAKLYGTTRLRTVEVLGDISTLASSLPDLQVYVLASTADLDLNGFGEIDKACAREGIDFVFLGLSKEGLSDLGALAVSFWDQVTSSLLQGAEALATWAVSESRLPAVKACLADIRLRLSGSIRSQRALTLRSREQILGRLFPSSPRPAGTSINPMRLVRRRAIEANLSSWWASPGHAALLVVGEEGLGKSWAVAAWLRAQAESLALPVAWFDSHRWQSVNGLDDLAGKIAIELATSTPPRQEENQRLLGKLMSRWPAPACLVVLDGANEGKAPHAIHQILIEYLDARGKPLAERLKLVITTRPTEAWLRGNLRRGCTVLQVPLFSEEELEEGVRKASGGQVGAEVLPAPLRELARRPRYLELAFELRDRLGDFAVVTVESVLFARLRRLLEDEADLLGISPGLDAVANLVEVTSAQAGRRVLEEEAERRLVNGARVLRDLEDIGWIQQADGGLRGLTATHVRLAWALFFLRRAARQRLDSPLRQRIEELRAVQEPGLNDDLRNAALGTALELIASGLVDRHAFATASLLGTWVLSHNLRLEGPSFSEIFDREPRAYCEVIEVLLALQNDLPWAEQLVAPLAEVWRQGGTKSVVLREYLMRWLLLVWDESGEPGEQVRHQGVDLPRTASWRALQLEKLAIGVLAQRPDQGLLQSLCRQAGSWDLSRDKDRMPYKDPFQWAGVLMRWGFGESSLGELERIATDPSSAPFEVTGAKRLAGALRQARLPLSLRSKGNYRNSRQNRFAEEIQSLRAGRPGLLSSVQPDLLGSRHWPEEIAALAADPSVPDLEVRDLDALKAGLGFLVRENTPWDGPAPGRLDLAFDVWVPWLARLDTHAWADLLHRLIEKALDYRDPHYLMSQVPALLPWPAEAAISKRLPRKISAVATVAKDGDLEPKHLLLYLLRLAIHLEDRARLHKCLTDLSRRRGDLPDVINWHPLPALLRLKVDAALFEKANRQLEKKLSKGSLSFWLRLAAAYLWTRPAEERLAWFFKVAKFTGSSEPTARLLLDFLLDIDRASALSVAMENPDLRALLDDPYFRSAAASWTLKVTGAELPSSYDFMIRSFPIQSIGNWLRAAGRAEEFQRWVRDLFAAMTAKAEQCDSVRAQKGWIEWEDCSGPRRVRLASREIFESDFSLQEWARQEPAEFRALLAGFIAQIKAPYHSYWELAGFVEAVAIAWLELEPSGAYRWLQSFQEEVRHSSTTNGVPSMIYHLWDLKFCMSVEHQEFREILIRAASSDYEIAAHALAARMHGALKELDRIIDPLRRSSAQLERALAVSILAWHPSGERRLKRLRDHDPSLWVRGHANWAFRICQRDRIGREVYRKALEDPEIVGRQAKLQQLAPLLMPTFHVWRFEDKAFRELEGRLEERGRALLVEFKHQATRQDLSREKFFGRELAKYCRGEDLDRYSRGLGRQLFPWW